MIMDDNEIQTMTTRLLPQSNTIVYLKGQVASISSKSATNFFFDYWRSSSSNPTPFHLDWHQYAHILRNLSQVSRKTAHSEASHPKN